MSNTDKAVFKPQDPTMKADRTTNDGVSNDAFMFVDEEEDAYYERMKEVHELYRKLDILITQEALSSLSDEITAEIE